MERVRIPTRPGRTATYGDADWLLHELRRVGKAVNNRARKAIAPSRFFDFVISRFQRTFRY